MQMWNSPPWRSRCQKLDGRRRLSERRLWMVLWKKSEQVGEQVTPFVQSQKGNCKSHATFNPKNKGLSWVASKSSWYPLFWGQKYAIRSWSCPCHLTLSVSHRLELELDYSLREGPRIERSSWHREYPGPFSCHLRWSYLNCFVPWVFKATPISFAVCTTKRTPVANCFFSYIINCFLVGV